MTTDQRHEIFRVPETKARIGDWWRSLDCSTPLTRIKATVLRVTERASAVRKMEVDVNITAMVIAIGPWNKMIAHYPAFSLKAPAIRNISVSRSMRCLLSCPRSRLSASRVASCRSRSSASCHRWSEWALEMIGKGRDFVDSTRCNTRPFWAYSWLTTAFILANIGLFL